MQSATGQSSPVTLRRASHESWYQSPSASSPCQTSWEPVFNKCKSVVALAWAKQSSAMGNPRAAATFLIAEAGRRHTRDGSERLAHGTP